MKKLKISLPDQEIEIPYIEIKGRGEGKRCIISGGIHGDEVNGIYLVKKFLDFCREKEVEKYLFGDLVIIPILNPLGFEKHSRFFPLDKKDLNRAFSRKTKSASNIIADALENKLYSKADLAIDCHDSGKRNILIPHARVHRFEDKFCTNCTRDLASAFGSKIIVERKGKKGMLAVEMTKKYRLPVLTVEVGGAQKIDPKYIDKSLDGIVNILRSQGFLPGEPRKPRKQYYLRHRFGIPSKETGIINFKKKLGQRVHLGDNIGKIYVPTKAKTIDVISPMCGLIFSIQHVDSVAKGEILYSILEDKKCHRKRRMTTPYFDELRNIKM